MSVYNVFDQSLIDGQNNCARTTCTIEVALQHQNIGIDLTVAKIDLTASISLLRGVARKRFSSLSDQKH